ncbi:mitotic spindle checkpoint protein Bub3 [Maudiozyma exigua]|uniref:Mitotic spindle checkpoint protein Bub3 n=1 Tax=Maudiozyma exigua TaxID=34358 RepID=A0A9P6VZH8_MAUEX|nr:mitotic spindle checkpoint protein Bub3 [Kazachstania exigua]
MQKLDRPNLVPLHDLLNNSENNNNNNNNHTIPHSSIDYINNHTTSHNNSDSNNNSSNSTNSANSSATSPGSYHYKSDIEVSTPNIHENNENSTNLHSAISPVSEQSPFSSVSKLNSLHSEGNNSNNNHSAYITHNNNNGTTILPSSHIPNSTINDISRTASIAATAATTKISISKYDQSKTHNLPSPTCSISGNNNTNINSSSSSNNNNNNNNNSGVSTPPEDVEAMNLVCKWDNCNKFLVHIPLKPFACSSYSGNIMKRKRGPKVGSKRINKNGIKSVDNKHVQTDIDQRSRSLPSTSFTTLPHLNNGFRKFITNDIQSYQPVLTHRLDTRLQNIMGQTLTAAQLQEQPHLYHPIDKTLQGPNMSSERVSVSSVMDTLPRHVATNAAGFFSELSNNMVNNTAFYQQQQQQQQQQQTHPNIQLHSHPQALIGNYSKLPPLNGVTSYPTQQHTTMIESSMNVPTNKITMLPSMTEVSGLQPRY